MCAPGRCECPAMMTAARAARHCDIGINKLRRLSATEQIPSWTDPDTGYVHYSRAVLDAWLAAAVNPRRKEAS